MGYIKKVVQTGVEFADKYEMPKYVMTARESSKIIDVASEKIVNVYCEKGSPLLEMVDDFTAAKIETALAVANSKVDQAKMLKTAASAKVQEKKTEAIELAKQTKATAYAKSYKAKDLGIAKYESFKMFSSKKAEETKTIMMKRVNYASEEACRFEQILENKLKEKAKENEYANKVLSVVMTAKAQVKIYGEALVKKSLSLPLTLQERMEKGLSFATEKVHMGSAAVKAKKAELVTYARQSYEKMTKEKEKLAELTKEKLAELKKANLYGKVTDQMTSMYKYSTVQVVSFAEKAGQMEAKYLGTSFVCKVMGKK